MGVVVSLGVFVTWVQLFFARFRVQISWQHRQKLIADDGLRVSSWPCGRACDVNLEVAGVVVGGLAG